MKVKIGRQTWYIDRDPPDDHHGLCNYETRTISIRSGLTMEDCLETCIHEGLHALDPSMTEAQVRRWAKQLTAICAAVMT